MKWISGGRAPPGPKGPTPLRGVVPRSPLLRQALKCQGKGKPAANPPSGSKLGARLNVYVRRIGTIDWIVLLALNAAISFVGLFARPHRPRRRARAQT